MTDAVVPNQELALSEAPRSSVDASVFQRPVAIARGLEQLGSGMEDLAVPLAKQAAQDDARTEMTLDANGQPQAASPLNSVILGKAGQEYQDVLQQGIQAGLHAKIQTDVAQLHAQNPTDIDAFKASLQGYTDRYRTLYPGQIGDGLANLANDYGAQHATNIVESTVTRDAQESLQAIQTNIDTNLNWLKAAARQGAVDTDAYKMKQAELSDAYDQLGTNKLYGYSPEKIAAEKDNSIDLLNGEYVVGQIDQTFNRKGKAAAAEAIKTSIDNNPDLDLSDAQRNNLHNYAMSRLDYLTNEQASSIAALKPTADLQVKALQSGNSGPNAIPEREIDATVAQLRSLGAFKEADQLDTARIVADRTVAFRNLMPDQKEQVLFGAAGAGGGGPVASGINTEQGAVQYFVSQGWSQAQAAGIVGNLVHESGGKLNPAAANRGDGADGSDSIGIGQWNSTRAADLKTFAAAQGKPWQDLGVQLAFVQHELTGSESAAAAKLKGASTAQDAASAFALGYERPQGFQTGDMTQVAGGQNRIDQATRIAAGGGSSTNIPGAAGVATVGTPYSDAEAQKNAWYTAAFRQQVQVDDATQIRYAKASMETLQNSIKFTGNPSPEMIPQASAALQIADAHPDQLGAEATKLRGALAGSRAGFAAADQPDGGQNLLDQVNQLALAAV